MALHHLPLSFISHTQLLTQFNQTEPKGINHMTIHSILGTLIPVFMFRALVEYYAKRKSAKAVSFLYNVADYAPGDKSEVLLLNHYYGLSYARIEELI